MNFEDVLNEIRMKDPESGGEKGVKGERYEFLPVRPLRDVARVYGYGARKYADRNWERGYNWSWSYGALQRHVNAFWGGEELDPESGLPHLAHATFHLLALMEFTKTHPEKDDRSKDEAIKVEPLSLSEHSLAQMESGSFPTIPSYTSSERYFINTIFGNRDSIACENRESPGWGISNGSKLGRRGVQQSDTL